MAYTVRLIGGPADGEKMRFSGNGKSAPKEAVIGGNFPVEHAALYRRGAGTMGTSRWARKRRITAWDYEYLEGL